MARPRKDGTPSAPCKNPEGRPHTDLDEVERKLLQWALLPDSINLNKFCAYNDLDPSMVLHWSKTNEKFSRAYRKAKAFIGFRREELLNSGGLHNRAYERNATVYDVFMKGEEREQLEFESQLKAQENKSATDEDKRMYDALMSQISSLQSDRKIPNNNIINEEKS